MDEKTNDTKKTGKKRNIFGSVFPQKYDFEAMLVEQAENTLAGGMETFIQWINEETLTPPDELISVGSEVDLLRYKLEARLIERSPRRLTGRTSTCSPGISTTS
ncbi:hypothetical protein [Methanogenium cariaci]|uniref:hypothetical protein n=1 Tax=Methanogenium cariaci TaxID=2197 RepID=UPI0007853357|nr:hypothetical protein [Methanogenium cariaci]